MRVFWKEAIVYLSELQFVVAHNRSTSLEKTQYRSYEINLLRFTHKKVFCQEKQKK